MREEGALERQNIARLQLEKYAPSVHGLFLPLKSLALARNHCNVM
jgi:hypothetical protein